MHIQVKGDEIIQQRFCTIEVGCSYELRNLSSPSGNVIAAGGGGVALPGLKTQAETSKRTVSVLSHVASDTKSHCMCS